jgi:hypothetical protein
MTSAQQIQVSPSFVSMQDRLLGIFTKKEKREHQYSIRSSACLQASKRRNQTIHLNLISEAIRSRPFYSNLITPQFTKNFHVILYCFLHLPILSHLPHLPSRTSSTCRPYRSKLHFHLHSLSCPSALAAASSERQGLG